MKYKKVFEMLPYDDMPDNNQDLTRIEISFPHLPFPYNLPLFCPRKVREILEYLRREGEEQITKNSLMFLRTARVAEAKYWIWEFYDSENRKCYVTVSQAQNGSTCIGYEEDYYHLTPEQFMLGDYHHIF
jgi:hypothetical protein